MKEFKIENHLLVVKEAKTILFGISTELIQNPDNKNLCDAFQTITNILRRPILPILFGTDMKWKESDIGVALLDKLYINMQSIKRYEYRIKELVDIIEQEQEGKNKTQHLRDQPTDVFISYCWANSHDAVRKGIKIILFYILNNIIFSFFPRYKINEYFNWLGRSSNFKSTFFLIRYILPIDNNFYSIGLS